LYKESDIIIFFLILLYRLHFKALLNQQLATPTSLTANQGRGFTTTANSYSFQSKAECSG